MARDAMCNLTGMKIVLPHSPSAAACRVSAIALTLCLFVLGSFPEAGRAFPGIAHWIVHFSVYAAVAVAYGLGWRERSVLLIGGCVVALGVIHEYSEIYTHKHALEIADIVVNSFGGGAGMALARALVTLRTSEKLRRN